MKEAGCRPARGRSRELELGGAGPARRPLARFLGGMSSGGNQAALTILNAGSERGLEGTLDSIDSGIWV